jgi:N-acetylglucosamine kinase-like BadF-type ATPase
VVGQSQAGTANPSVIGRVAATDLIRQTMRSALDNARLSPAQISAVGIGVAGGSAEYSENWLREIVSDVTPWALIAPSSDHEIALVGAHGKREGVLILAGTGSVAYGVNAEGQSWRVGGWGYLLGDEGSGYWLGNQALQAVARMADGREVETSLMTAILDRLEIADPRQIIAWLYHREGVRTAEVAKLALLVLEHAAHGDEVAQAIVERGAEELARHVQTIIRRLKMDTPAIAFAGGLLTAVNPLSEALCAKLGLENVPTPLHTPVIGAALLALRRYEDGTH